MVIGPGAVLVAGAVVLGLAGGVVLSVPAYRLAVARTEAALAGCRDCATPLPAGPGGWLRPRVRCPACRGRLGPHPALLGGLGAIACAGLAWRLGAVAELPAYLFLALLGVLLAAIDLACRRLPDALVLPGFAVTALLLTVAALATGHWAPLLRALLGAAAMLAGYAVLSFLPGAPVGGGDVTLAALLGLGLAWLGWPVLVVGVLLSYLVNAPVAVVALIRRGRRARVPFGPAMLAGAYLAAVGPAAVRAMLAA